MSEGFGETGFSSFATSTQSAFAVLAAEAAAGAKPEDAPAAASGIVPLDASMYADSAAPVFGSGGSDVAFGAAAPAAEAEAASPSRKRPREEDDGSTAAAAASFKPQLSGTAVDNGEASEQVVAEVRAVLYVYKSPAQEAKRARPAEDKDSDAAEESAAVAEVAAGEDAKQEDGSADAAPAAAAEAASESSSLPQVATQAASSWVERGTGPIRLLKDQGAARLVLRQEAAPGGPGTQVVVNSFLTAGTPWTLTDSKTARGGRFVRTALTLEGRSEPSRCLLLFKQGADAETLTDAVLEATSA